MTNTVDLERRQGSHVVVERNVVALVVGFSAFFINTLCMTVFASPVIKSLGRPLTLEFWLYLVLTCASGLSMILYLQIMEDGWDARQPRLFFVSSIALVVAYFFLPETKFKELDRLTIIINVVLDLVFGIGYSIEETPTKRKLICKIFHLERKRKIDTPKPEPQACANAKPILPLLW